MANLSKLRAILMLLGFLAVSVPASFGQNFHFSVQGDTTVHLIVDAQPVLTTPEKEYSLPELRIFINKHLKWPKNNLDCEGIVVISFIVEKDGSKSNTKLVRRMCPGFDEEALRVVNLMQNWKPGILKEEKVKSLSSYSCRILHQIVNKSPANPVIVGLQNLAFYISFTYYSFTNSLIAPYSSNTNPFSFRFS